LGVADAAAVGFFFFLVDLRLQFGFSNMALLSILSSSCFVSPEDDQVWQIVFWFFPVGVGLFFGCMFTALSIIRIAMHSFHLKRAFSFFSLHVRLILFALMFLVCLVIDFAYSIQIAAHKDDIKKGLDDYYVCSIRGLDCTLDDSVSNYALVALKGVALSCIGTLLFMIFFTSKGVIVFWWSLARALARAAWTRKRSDVVAALLLVRSDTSIQLTLSNTQSLTLSSAGEAVDCDDASEETDENEDEDDDDDDDEDGAKENTGSTGEEMDVIVVSATIPTPTTDAGDE
jgi:hypothetical protein